MLALALLCALQADPEVVAAPGHWPQWRGPARDGASTERNLLREWPAGGPALLWKTTGLGEGLGCIAVAGGLLFAQGNVGDKDVVAAFDGRGRKIWSVPIGPASGERGLMRYVTQRSPTVDDGLLFVTTWQGMISCLDSTNGRIPITASKKYGCTSFGLEIDRELLRTSRKASADAKVDLLVTWVEKDLFEADLSKASVVTLYLGASNNARLLPKLRALKAGARIVSHEHLLGPEGPAPDRTLKMVSSEDHSEHTIHVWTAPLSR